MVIWEKLSLTVASFGIIENTKYFMCMALNSYKNVSNNME
jgi:hypothetical protein